MPSSHRRHQDGRVDAIDRVRFRLDNPISGSALKHLGCFCRDVFLTPLVVPYQARWTYDLDVLQPHRPTFFLALEDALSAGTTGQPYYVEVARDYLTTFQIEARRMTHYFLRHAMLRYSRGEVQASGAGYYYNKRKSAITLVIYGDRSTKQFGPNFGRPAFHIELRLDGVEALIREGLRGPQDFARLNFDRFLDRHLSFWLLPSKTILGIAVGCQSPRDDSLQRATRHAIAQDGTLENGTFCLQKFAAQYAGVKNVLRPLSSKDWERTARDLALAPTWFFAP
jgi:hypothetical protein